MTRLTTNMRRAFVTAVIDDVPHVDYQEKARIIVQKFAISKAPQGVLDAIKANPDWLKVETYVYMPEGILGCIVVARDAATFDKHFKANKNLYAEIVAMGKANNAQFKNRQQLRDKVKGLANSVTTVKALRDIAPEFAKYLTGIESPIDRSVPVVQNVVADLVKAGWPKGK